MQKYGVLYQAIMEKLPKRKKLALKRKKEG